MNTQNIRDLAIKLLGLYFFAQAVVWVPQIIGALSIANMVDYVAYKSIFVFALLLPLIFYCMIAYVLILKTRIVMVRLWPEQEQNTSEANAVSLSLTTWISLIGLFYFVGSVGGVLTELYIIGTKRELAGAYLSFKFIPSVITMIISIVCIAKAHAIANFLKRKAEQSTQQGGAGYAAQGAASPDP